MEDIRFEDMDLLNAEDEKRLARMLACARAESGMSQEAVALELGIARKTVQNWEKGSSTPTLPQAIAWFRVMKVAAMPYFIQFMFPDMEGIRGYTEDRKVLESLLALIETLPMEGVRQLMYLFYGNHGSSPRAVINMVTAYLQMPLKERYNIDCAIGENYSLAKEMGTITHKENIQPDEEIMRTAIAREREAVIESKSSYMLL